LISVFYTVLNLSKIIITAYYDRSIPENSGRHDNLRWKVSRHAHDFADPQACNSNRRIRKFT